MKKALSGLLLLLTASFSFAQNCVPGTFSMSTQNWASEISWSIVDELGGVQYSSQSYQDYSQTAETVCLFPGCYMLQMEDSFGDGWNGAILSFNDIGGSYSTFTLGTGNFQIIPFAFATNDSCEAGGLIFGCTDSTALNYNPFATIDDGSCNYQQNIYGCTDPAASNYSPWATIDNGSCQYPMQCDSGVVADLYICVFSLGANVGFELIDDSGNIVYSQFGFPNYAIEHVDVCLQEGTCYTANMYNTSGPQGWYNGYFWVNGQGVQYITDELYPGEAFDDIEFSIDGTCGDIFGCTDPAALNYNPLATEDNGTCQYPAQVFGCMDSTAFNYNPFATLDDGSCFFEDSCSSNTGTLTMNTASWGNEISFSIINETNETVYQFNGFQNTTAYTYPICLEDGCYSLEMYDSFGDGWNGGTLFLSVNGAMVLSNITMQTGNYASIDFGVNTLDCGDNLIPGCMNPNALNYNPFANIDDGSCEYQQDSLCQAYWEIIGIDQEGDIVNLWNGSYGNNLSYLWDFGDGTTSNDPYPTHQYAEDGTYMVCLTVFEGNGGALNCTSTYCDTISYYNPPVIGGSPGSFGFYLNVGSSQVLSASDLQPLNDLNVYPNPSQNILNLTFNLSSQENIRLRVYDISGHLVIEQNVARAMGSQRLTLDLSNLAEGSYMLDLQGQKSKAVKRFTVLR